MLVEDVKLNKPTVIKVYSEKRFRNEKHEIQFLHLQNSMEKFSPKAFYGFFICISKFRYLQSSFLKSKVKIVHFSWGIKVF